MKKLKFLLIVVIIMVLLEILLACSASTACPAYEGVKQNHPLYIEKNA